MIFFRRLLFLFLLVAVLAATGGDVLAKRYVEGQIAQKAREQAGGQASSSAHISGFPFVVKLLATGEVSEVDVRLDRAVAEGVALASLDVDLRGVHIDRQRLLTAGKAEITAIRDGTITVGFDGPGLTRLAHVAVEVSGGVVKVRAGGALVSATPSIDAAGTLSLKVGALPAARVKLPRSGLAACAAASVHVVDGRVEVSCTVHDVPPALLRAAQSGQP